MISVIIPVYNAEKTLKQCLESIFRQTNSEIEIIAVNDGSIDDSLAILRQYADRIKIINQSNAGAPTARNAGFKESRGEQVIFCDADVIMSPKMLEKMSVALDENPAAAYAYSSFRFGFKKFRLWPFDAIKLRQMPYIHTTSLIRREFFSGFDESLKKFQDWDLWLTILERGGEGVWLDEVLFAVKSGGTMSVWRPKVFYHLPWPKSVRHYDEAKEIIKKKHKII
jgi:glycosyltransferase involved in cell wall biosynthesis